MKNLNKAFDDILGFFYPELRESKQDPELLEKVLKSYEHYFQVNKIPKWQREIIALEILGLRTAHPEIPMRECVLMGIEANQSMYVSHYWTRIIPKLRNIEKSTAHAPEWAEIIHHELVSGMRLYLKLYEKGLDKMACNYETTSTLEG